MNETQNRGPATPGRTTLGWMAIAGVAALAVGLLAGPVLAAATSPAPRYAAPVSASSDTPPEHTISVSGSGKVTVVPDMATVSLGVQIERNTAKAARQAAAESMTKVIAALKALGIDDEDIATSSISLQPVYDYSNNSSPKVRGYQLQNAVTITIRDLDKVGDVLDDAVVSGATQVNGISFDVADRAASEAKAREAAVADARAKADTLAKGVGVQITGVSSMSETVSTPIWYGREMAAGAQAAPDAATPVMAGTTDVTISVQVVFLID
jgi:uncharacterized protein YggE